MTPIPYAEWVASPEVAYYGHADDDELTCDSIEEYVEMLLDDRGTTIAEALDATPWPLLVTAYRRETITELEIERLADDTLDRLLELINEEHGDPDGDGPSPTPAWRDAMLTAVKTIVATYAVWNCERVTTLAVSREDARAMIEDVKP